VNLNTAATLTLTNKKKNKFSLTPAFTKESLKIVLQEGQDYESEMKKKKGCGGSKTAVSRKIESDSN
jgi:hypothetical protein